MNIVEMLNEALRFQQTGQLSQAEKLCRQVLAADSMQVDAWHILGIVMGQMGRKELAVQYLKEALRLRPEFPEAQLNLGNALREASRHSEAVAAYQKCLQLRPDLPEAHYNFGNCLKDLGKTSEAADSFHAAVQLRPDYVKALNNLGNTLLDLGRAEEAAKTFAKTVELNPKYVAGLCNLGITMRRLGRPADAVTHLEKALAIDPKSCPCLNNLGGALAELDRPVEAAAVFQRLLEINPNYHQDRQSQATRTIDPARVDHAGPSLTARPRSAFDPPLISIVVPCYNGSRYLEACIRCVREQNVDHELILVNDGSKDDSYEKAREILRDDLSAVIISQPNQGLSTARNTGIRAARGKYIVFFDVDDLWTPDFCSTMLRILESDASLIAVACQMEIVGFHRPLERWHVEAVENGHACNLIIRTEIMKQLGGFPPMKAFRGQAGGEDCAFRAQLAKFGKMVKVLKPLYKYIAQHNAFLDFFVDRARMENGRIVFSRFSKEELDGTLVAATREYGELVNRRMVERATDNLRTAMQTTSTYAEFAQQFGQMGGQPQSTDRYALYWLAKNWPISGRTVEIVGPPEDRIPWLALGCKEANRDKVARITRLSGSATPAEGPSAATTETGGESSLQTSGLADWIATSVGDPSEIIRGWSEPIRLLLLGDETNVSSDFANWSKRLTPHGLAIFAVGTSGENLVFYNDLCSRKDWRSIARFGSLAIMERLP